MEKGLASLDRDIKAYEDELATLQAQKDPPAKDIAFWQERLNRAKAKRRTLSRQFAARIKQRFETPDQD